MKPIKEIKEAFNIIKKNCGCNGITKIHCSCCHENNCNIWKELTTIQDVINVFTKMVSIIYSIDYPENKEDKLIELLGEDFLEKEALENDK